MRFRRRETNDFSDPQICRGKPHGSEVKNPSANAGDAGDSGSIPGSGRSPGGGSGNSLHYPCLVNPMDRGAWRATVHGVAKTWTRRSNWAQRASLQDNLVHSPDRQKRNGKFLLTHHENTGSLGSWGQIRLHLLINEKLYFATHVCTHTQTHTHTDTYIHTQTHAHPSSVVPWLLSREVRQGFTDCSTCCLPRRVFQTPTDLPAPISEAAAETRPWWLSRTVPMW